jgi:hypothetical protein
MPGAIPSLATANRRTGAPGSVRHKHMRGRAQERGLKVVPRSMGSDILDDLGGFCPSSDGTQCGQPRSAWPRLVSLLRAPLMLFSDGKSRDPAPGDAVLDRIVPDVQWFTPR